MMKTQFSLASSYQLESSRSVPFPVLICLLLHIFFCYEIAFWGH